MEQNNNQTEKCPRQLNGFLMFLMIMGIFGSVMQIITKSSIFMLGDDYLSFFVFDALMILGIVVIAFILQMKRWALIAWFVLQLISPFIFCLLDGGFNDFIPQIIHAVVACGVFRLLLMLKKDGISAWDTIMSSDEDFEYLWHLEHMDESDEEDEEPVK